MKQAINKLKIWLLEIVFSESFPKLPVLFSEMDKASSDGMENEERFKDRCRSQQSPFTFSLELWWPERDDDLEGLDQGATYNRVKSNLQNLLFSELKRKKNNVKKFYHDIEVSIENDSYEPEN